MPLRQKALFFILIVNIIPLALIFYYSGELSKSFSEIEHKRMVDSLVRLKNVFEEQQNQLNSIAGEYANWDDTYNYALAPLENPDYPAESTSIENLKVINANIYIIQNTQSDVILAKFFSKGSDTLTQIPSELLTSILNARDAKTIVRYQNDVYLISRNPILTSLFQGPEAGNIILGRLLDSDHISKMEILTQSSINMNDPNRLSTDLKLNEVFNNLKSTETYVDTTSADVITGYLSIKSSDQKPLLIFEISQLRDIQKQSQRLVNIGFMLSVGAAFFYLISGYIFLEKSLLKRLNAMLKQILEISKTSNFSARLKDSGKDELGKLGENINKMIESLEVSEKYQKIINKELASKSLELENKGLELEKTNKSIEQKIQEKTQELRNEKAKLLAAINSIPFGLVITSDKKDLLLTNDVLNPVLRINEHKWTIEKLNDLFKPTWSLHQNIDSCLKRHRIIVIDNVEFRNRFLKVSIAPILMGHKETLHAIGCIVLFEDITEEKILQRSKDEFFSIASHELRTPLSVIRGNAQLIKKYYLSEIQSNNELGEIVTDIDSASVRMIGLVNDFLKTSKLEQNRIPFTLEVFDPTDPIIEVLNELQTMAEQKDLKFVFTKSTKPIKNVLADRERIKEVLINLIGNAIKFTEKGYVKVSISPDNEQLRVSVKDTGRGISKINQNLLFRKFQQATDNLYTRDTEKGTGLGLYISKLLVEGMGGKIFLEESEPDQGSTFVFTIPFEKNS